MSYAKSSAGFPEITDVNNYYPFGLNHIDGQISKGKLGSYLSYKYNGKELQETGMYDYGARMYMPDLGRWGVLDRASEHVPEFSPYTFTFNDPIGFVDNDGEFPGPTGAVIGILADYIGQVAGHYFFDNMSFKDSMVKDINYWSLGISGVTGALTGGIDSFKTTITSKVGKRIFVNMIDYGVDVLVNTVGGVLSDQLDEGKFDVWKSLTGGLIEAGVGKLIPLKYVDKLEKKLLHKMNVNANKAAKIKSKLGNVTRKKTIKKLEAKLQVAENNVINYTSAYTGVKTVNDVFKKTGVNGLTDQLFKKEEEPKKEGKLTIGEVISEKGISNQ
ncbi:RHS repeat-associated core domain-containing protein [Chryseobacterium indologenes]|uniref:RHS repeat-associated core domain-containing protein n=1 Tax=Chryseobacterium indologenes TaxID=253 RepID=A0A0N1KRP1_CHRID|nr:RHS repeat-associated core domain-containing protein [Chryseobacterium indologenes]KPE49786.1 hypothetical protein AOB46_17595 [Chryseobacterium indologenes]